MLTTRTNDPLYGLDALRRELERAFDRVTEQNGVRPSRWASFLPGVSARSYPLVNLGEDRDNVYVEALAPGLDPESLEITVQRDTLRVAGRKAGVNGDVKPEAWHRSERGAGSFVRTMQLPSDVNAEGVAADYANGLLRITLPKAEEAKPKQISVNVS
jgi:HSP20 family protein